MGSRLSLIKQIERAFRQLLDVTEEISSDLGGLGSTDDLDAIAAKLRKREELIETINSLQAQDVTGTEDAAETKAYEKHRWLCREIAKKISYADKENLTVMDAALQGFMEGLRTSRQSIRAVSAYAAQNPDDRL